MEKYHLSQLYQLVVVVEEEDQEKEEGEEKQQHQISAVQRGECSAATRCGCLLVKILFEPPLEILMSVGRSHTSSAKHKYFDYCACSCACVSVSWGATAQARDWLLIQDVIL